MQDLKEVKFSAKELISFSLGKSYIRAFCNARNNVPIEIIKGKSPPKYVGKSFYYTNRSGKLILHPSAYSRKGFSNMVYHNSTLRVEVGINWIGKIKISNPNTKVSILYAKLFEIDYHAIYVPSNKTYKILFKNSYYPPLYENLNLTQFRKIANKLIKMKIFS